MQRSFAGLAVLGSLGLLLGAFAFQYLGGLAPCSMCIWQRWPHAIAIVLGVAAMAMGARAAALLAGLAVLVGAGIAAYHVAVEQMWVDGPTTCTSGPIGSQTTEELLANIMQAPLVRCDEVAWSLAGISMAGWNGILSVAIAGLWLAAARGQLSSSASQ